MKSKQARHRDAPPGGGASLEELISPHNEVRFIDAFIDSLPLGELGFRTDFPDNGRPACHPCVLLKLLVYGYLKRIRSSRCLERECHRNLEAMWLLGQLAPDHNTIANFRKNNSRTITRVFRATVRMARHFQLIGGELLAGDSQVHSGPAAGGYACPSRPVKGNYLQLLRHLQDSREDQVSTSDPENRQLIIHNTITEVAYNVQATVDAQHCLLIGTR